MDGSSSLVERVAKAKAGDPKAIRDLLTSYENEVRMFVRGQLPQKMRAQFDSMDFVQAVWTSVFVKNGEMPEFANERHFLAYLAGVARNKVNEAHRSRTQQKYDLAREEPLYVRRGNREVLREVAAQGPTPSQDVQARDRLAQILDGRSDLERRVVELRRDGLTYAEIAEQLGVHESSVRRVVEAIRQRMEARRWL